MALNIDRLREGLEVYLKSLNSHNGNLQEDYKQLQEIFTFLVGVYEGESAEAFKSSWLRTADWFENYIQETEQLKILLRDRLDALKRERQS